VESLRACVFERYLPQNLKVRDPKTRKNYGHAFADFAAFLKREPDWADLNDETFAAFVNYLDLERDLAETTVNERAGRIKAFWTWAAKKRYVDQFPTIGRIPVPERLPVAWREDELVKLFNGCRMQRGYIGDVPAWRWWFSIHGWLWCTSERVGATLAMRVEHLRLDEGLAVLPAHIRKGRRKSMVYKLWPDLVQMFRAMLPPYTRQRELMFEWDEYFDRGTFYNRYDRMLQQLGLPHDRYRKPHAMRVSHATWTYLAGNDPTKALGHDDPATTRKSYLDPTLCRQDDLQLFRPWDAVPPPGAG